MNSILSCLVDTYQPTALKNLSMENGASTSLNSFPRNRCCASRSAIEGSRNETGDLGVPTMGKCG